MGEVCVRWQENGACKNADKNLFFPPKGGTGPEDSRRAKAICRNCPVRQPCLDEAIKFQIEDGIWGGMSRDERREERRRRRRVARQQRAAGW